MSMYGFRSAKEVVCVYNKGGYSHLAVLDTESKKIKNVELPYTAMNDVRVLRYGGIPRCIPNRASFNREPESG